MSKPVFYTCPWWCRASDHPRQGFYVVDRIGCGAVLHRATFDAPAADDGPAADQPFAEVISLDDEGCPPIVSVLSPPELATAVQARQLAAALLAAADLLDQCEGVTPL